MTTDNQPTTALSPNYRQRFFIEHSAVRGDVVQLTDAYQTVIAQKAYPQAIKALLGEMLVSASLLIGTLKINGRLSIQLQSTPDEPLSWAMAECDHTGAVRALAGFDPKSDVWAQAVSSQDAFRQLGGGVLFINIHPERGEAYQGIVERVSDDLGECLAHYQKQSAQIPTIIKLATDDLTAGGMLVQLMPQTEEDKEKDPDLWNRLSVLTSTIKANELTELPAGEILYRLYHEEEVVLPEEAPLHFACTCSQDKSAAAIIQLGEVEAEQAAIAHGGTLVLDCGFCGAQYAFDAQAIAKLFADDIGTA